jgi:lipoprotein-anchoring transpeptidase ErfK/SrfK
VQTLKTAIVVLLMMTVIYGSYVSLTTPPDALPDQVASLIQESGSFELDIDEGLPESLANLEIDNGTPKSDSPAVPDFASEAPDHSGSPDPSMVIGLDAPGISNEKESPETSSTPVTQSFSDASSFGAATPIANAAGAKPKVGGGDAGIVDLQLPKTDGITSIPNVDPTRNYPATGPDSLTLPDPRSIEALPASGWKKDATQATFELPSKSDPVTAQLSDESRDPSVGFAMPANGNSTPPSLGSLTPPATSTSTAPAAASPAAPVEPNQGLANAIRTADRQYAADQPMDALLTLSLFYNSPDLTPSDRDALISRLDPLAASVIYSRRHLLEQPHRVAANETLMEIAAKYELPWQLLANINGIEDPVAVVPGTELKVMRGPFRAEVDPARNELTIFLRDLYAGRFKIAVGAEPAPQPGTYTIQEKQSARTFYDRNGSPVPPGDARNPYGTVWMDLGKQLCIHGSPDRNSPSTSGCISLSGDDADDLYGILSQGSSVTIRR